MRPLEQLVDNPCGVGIVWDGVITPVLHKQRESGSYHCVCAEYSYCGGLAVLLFEVDSLAERSSGVSLS